MKKLALFVAVAAFALSAGAAEAKDLKTYKSLAEAKKLCKTPVVWVTTSSMVYHAESSKNFGKTQGGAYACEAGAKAAGAKAAKNGQ